MRAGVIGCGAIASRWLRALMADGRVVPAVLVDPDRAAAARLGGTHSLDVPVVTELDEALAGYELDLVVNLTPPGAHAAVSGAALSSGVHVLSEKPLATSLDDAVRLVELAAHRNLWLCVMQNRGRDARMLAFADHVRRRSCGPLVITADVFVDLRAPGFRSKQAVVATLDLAIHAFDQIRRLIRVPPLSVCAHETPLTFWGEHCAMTVMSVEFADGSIFAYRGGYTTSPGPRSSANGHWDVRGRDVHVTWDGDSAAVLVDRDSVLPERLAMPVPASSHLSCITEMLDAIDSSSSAPCLPVDSLRSVALLDAALGSAASGRPAGVRQLPRTFA